MEELSVKELHVLFHYHSYYKANARWRFDCIIVVEDLERFKRLFFI